MRAVRTVQPLSYELRLPDAVQAAALRLLDASREVINATQEQSHLIFGTASTGCATTRRLSKLC